MKPTSIKVCLSNGNDDNGDPEFLDLVLTRAETAALVREHRNEGGYVERHRDPAYIARIGHFYIEPKYPPGTQRPYPTTKE